MSWAATVVDALGCRHSTTYDVAGRTLTSVDLLGCRVTPVFDSADRTVGMVGCPG